MGRSRLRSRCRGNQFHPPHAFGIDSLLKGLIVLLMLVLAIGHPLKGIYMGKGTWPQGSGSSMIRPGVAGLPSFCTVVFGGKVLFWVSWTGNCSPPDRTEPSGLPGPKLIVGLPEPTYGF
ncbi:hypothetical protein Nepgr_022179 [Nepenthes gracilis]|uniref:Uncharacterized protein n=1 Tax=Nepenthes gracilis TaxID=150966 RepID=A0AAD3XWQ7_NEPGR|nr:hypothetical protein Nepgr_022179 [Nepenthes gracilis]